MATEPSVLLCGWFSPPLLFQWLPFGSHFHPLSLTNSFAFRSVTRIDFQPTALEEKCFLFPLQGNLSTTPIHGGMRAIAKIEREKGKPNGRKKAPERSSATTTKKHNTSRTSESTVSYAHAYKRRFTQMCGDFSSGLAFSGNVFGKISAIVAPEHKRPPSGRLELGTRRLEARP